MLDKTKLYLCYGALILVLIAGVSYKLGYNAKHTPQYIHVKYQYIENNLFKVFKDCGIDLNKEQQDAVLERIKIDRGNK